MVRSYPSVNRWVEFKFKGIGIELYTRDHDQMHIGFLGMAIEDLGG